MAGGYLSVWYPDLGFGRSSRRVRGLSFLFSWRLALQHRTWFRCYQVSKTAGQFEISSGEA